MGEATIAQTADDTPTDYLLRRLPPWMPKDESTGNYKLVDTIGRALGRLESDVQTLDEAVTVQEANTIDQLRRLAQLVGVPPRENEPVEQYRARVIAEYQKMTSEGTPAHVINNAATILDCSPSEIGYEKLAENGVARLDVPGTALDQVSLDQNEFVSIITEHAAAGFRIEATIRGTFTYVTPTEYQNSNFDSSRGYDGLDSNGNPKDNGGTYAGLIE